MTKRSPKSKDSSYTWPRVPLIDTRQKVAEKYGRAEDYGFFGPDSVSWKVWSHSSSLILGFVRSVTIEHLDPNLTAAVVQSGGVKYRTHTRYGRTMAYFSQVTFGAARPTAKAADVLVKVHSKAIGTDPVTGGRYDANDPESQLWIHVTAWHSILYCYEKFGGGTLAPAEELRYWDECARAAELQTIDPDRVPRSRAEVVAYFEEKRPHLASSEAAIDMVKFILSLHVALPPTMSRWQRAPFLPLTFILSKAVIATYPKYMRDLLAIRQGPLVNAVAIPATWAVHQVIERSFVLKYFLMSVLSPQALPSAIPAVLGVEAEKPVTTTPREAQARYGYDVPREAHLGFRAKQYQRVFDDGQAPSEEGLVESQEHIGAM
ncbi:MAG: oxygenase MpaB family protein [Gordonia sp. (in: high G+C Gram-positive bacteria)]|uniref:oxygenase MpaB family protein n=1 Tax=Gordonia sp. (in: high G+C Gram-positive bacteria) TaxID=84139 RepID=UPI0039E413A6